MGETLKLGDLFRQNPNGNRTVEVLGSGPSARARPNDFRSPAPLPSGLGSASRRWYFPTPPCWRVSPGHLPLHALIHHFSGMQITRSARTSSNSICSQLDQTLYDYRGCRFQPFHHRSDPVASVISFVCVTRLVSDKENFIDRRFTLKKKIGFIL